MNSLREIATILRAVLPNEALFSLVNTRITLKTGVDLSSVDLASREGPETITQVMGALQAMGYSAQTLKVLAKSKGIETAAAS